MARSGEGLLGALCARGELELAPRVTCSLYTHHTPELRTQLTGHRETTFCNTMVRKRSHEWIWSTAASSHGKHSRDVAAALAVLPHSLVLRHRRAA